MRLRAFLLALLVCILAACGALADVVTYNGIHYVFKDAREGAAELCVTLSGERVDPRTLEKETLSALPGGVFGVYVRGADGQPVPYPDPANPAKPLTLTTGEEPVRVNLPLSVELYLVQLSAPEGYRMALEEPLRLQLPCEIELSCQALGETGVRVALFADADEGPAPLADVSFRLEGENDCFELTTGADGVALFSGITAGEYTLRQLSVPAPYSVDEETLRVTVRAGEVTNVEIVNSRPGSLTLRVLGLSADAVADSVRMLPVQRSYQVTATDGSVVGTIASGETLPLPASQQGTAYVLTALGAEEDGFAADPEAHETLVYSGRETPAQVMLENRSGFFAMTHTSGAGGTFALYDKAGTEVFRFVTDENGRYAAKTPLAAGEYTLRMLHAAPGGQYSDETVTVQVSPYFETRQAAQAVFEGGSIPQELLAPAVTCSVMQCESLFAQDAQVSFALRAPESRGTVTVSQPVFEIDWENMPGLTVTDDGADGEGAFTLARRFALQGVEEKREFMLRGTVEYEIAYPVDGEGGMESMSVRAPFAVCAAEFAPAENIRYDCSGHLTGADGEPLAGRIVRLVGAQGETLAQIQTDPFGGYAFADAPGGSSIEITPDAGFGVRMTADGATMLPLETVRAVASGTGIPTETEIIVSYGSLGEKTLKLGEEALFTGLPLETDAFAVETPEGILYRMFETGTGTMIRLFRAASVSGTVCDPDGMPLAGVQVRLEDETAVTGADGAFTFANLYPGSYALSVAAPEGYLPVFGAEETIVLKNGENAAHSVVAMLPAQIAGELTENGAPLGGVAVTLGDRQTVTDDAGSFAFDGVTVGEYTLSFDVPADTAVLNVPEKIVIAHSAQREMLRLQTVRAASVSGSVWHDEDDNSLRSAAETGVSGAVVTVYTADGRAIESVTLKRDGAFTFDGLLPGEYRVGVKLPEGMIFTRAAEGMDRFISGVDGYEGMSDPFTIVSGEKRQGLLCGAVVSGCVSGSVWQDENGDGKKDGAEAPIEKAVLTLLENGEPLRTAETGADGAYAFENLRAGDYTLRVTLPEGMLLTGGRDSAFEKVDSNQAETAVSVRTWRTQIECGAGGVVPARIFAKVFCDETADGALGGAESGMAGVTVALRNASGVRPVTVAETVTDENGAAVFEAVRPGMYTLAAKLPQGWTYTTPETGEMDVRTAMGGDAVDFGCIGMTKLGKISGTVFVDSDYDGLRAENERGAAILVSLLNADGETVAATRTSIAGKYEFEGLKAGKYVVSFSLPEGWAFTKQRADAPSFNSDVPETAANTAQTATLYLPMGESLPVDAGCYEPSSVAGTVWLDEADTGRYPGETAGLAGVCVTLLRAEEIVAETTTDEDGAYRFEMLPPGVYTLRAALPEGLLPAQGAAEKTITLEPGDRRAGFRMASVKAASVSGKTGVPDMAVTLSGREGEYAVVTDETGAFRVENVRPGEYTLFVQLPEGWAFTAANDAARALRLKPGEAMQTEYAIVPEAVVEGFVWLDENGDRSADGETPLPGVTITLNREGKNVAQAVADETGAYRFDALPPGAYSLQFAAKDAAIRFDATQPLTLHEGAAEYVAVAAWKPAAVLGRVWDDRNADGMYRYDEEHVPGATITLLDAQGVLIAQTQTDENGTYAFEDVRPGIVSVRFEIAVDSVFTNYNEKGSLVRQTDGQTGVTEPCLLRSGERMQNISVGTLRAGRVGDRVWLDENGNGLQDSSEPGLAGVMVKLLRIAADYTETEIALAVTDANGRYRFTGVRPDRYRVAFIPAEGYAAAEAAPDFPHLTSAIITDRDGMFLTEAFMLESGEAVLNQDAGFVVKQEN